LLPEAALKSGEPLFEEDVLALPNRPLFQGEGLRSVAILPLRTRETLLGILELGTRRTIRHFSREGRELLRAISDQAAVAIENAQLYAETRRRVDEIETLFAIQQAITSRLDVPTVLQLIADEARRLTASRITVVFMLEDGELCVSVISSDEPVNVPIGYRMPVADSITAEAIKNGQPVRIDNIAAEPKAHIDLVKRLNIHALMILPLMSGAKVIGSISLIDKASGRFDSQDERVLNMLASSAVIGLENARLYQEEHTRRQEAEQRRQIAESLRDILTVLNSNRPVDEILEQIVAQAERLLGANAVAIYQLSGQEGTVRIQAAHGLLEEYMATMEFPVGEGLVRRAVTHRHPITVTDPNQLFQTNFQSLQQNPEHWSLFIEVIGRYRALLAVPLIIKNEVYGGIVLYYIQAPSFSEEEIGLAVSFADQVALAIENARLFDQAEQAAILEERQRLARELHDSVTQSLYGVTMFAEAATRLLNAGQVDLATGHLGELRSTAQEALQEMRLLLFELRPPVLEQEGLVAALQTRLEAVERRSGLATELKVSGPETLKLPAKIEDGLYRIAQEALNNALKHAQATQVKVQLSHDVQQVSLEISDNGCGFDPTTIRQRAGLGLRGIEERAKQLGAQLVIKSEPHYGTNIRVEVRL
jgi:signal transduction histidine kinase/putative methionine-R-sulfoxide reductase with GAF domain